MTDAEYLSSVLANANTPTTPTSIDTLNLLGNVTPQPQFDVEDADTVNSMRLLGFDAPESVEMEKKATKIKDLFGISLEDQRRLGKAGTARTKELLQNPDYQNFDITGEVGHYGRLLAKNDPLKNTLIAEGHAVPMDRYDQKAQDLYRKADEKRRALGMYDDANIMKTLREYNTEFHNPGFTGSVGKMADAFQSGGVQALGKLGDFVTDIGAWGAEGVGADNAADYLDKLGETWSNPTYADKLTGYDRREAEYRQAEVLHEFKQGNYTGAFLNALTVAPEMVAESLPIMFEMIVGGGKVKALSKLPKVLNNNLGFAAVIGQETNKQAEEFEAENGRKVTGGELAQMAAINLATYGIDRLAFKEILGMKHELSGILGKTSQSTKKGLMNKALRVGGQMAKATGYEGAQEYVQTWGEILNVNVDKSWNEMFSDEQAQGEAIIGGIMGAAGGTVMSGGATPIREINQMHKDKKVEKAVAELSKQDVLKQFNSAIEESTSPAAVQLKENLINVLTDKDLTLEESREVLEDLVATNMDESTRQEDIDTIVDFYNGKREQALGSKEEVVPEPEVNVNKINPQASDAIKQLAVKMANGYSTEELTAEELQLQQNEGPALEAELNKIQETNKDVPTNDELPISQETTTTEETVQEQVAPKDVKSKLEAKVEKITQRLKLPKVAMDFEEQVVEEGGKKDKRYEKVDDNLLSAILTEGMTTEELTQMVKNPKDSKIVERFSKHLDILGKNFESLRELVDLNTNNTKTAKQTMSSVIDFDGNPEDVKGQLDRAVIVGVQQVLAGMESTKHEAINAGLEIEPSIAALHNIQTQIGKNYLNSYGAKLKGTAKDNNQVYNTIGREILDYLNETGLIEYRDKELVAVPQHAVTPDNIPVTERRSPDQAVENLKIFKGGKNTRIPQGKIGMYTKVVKVNDKLYGDFLGQKSKTPLAKAITRMSTFLLPGNYELPVADTKGKVTVDENREINPQQKEIIEKLSSLKFSVKPEFIQFFQEVKEYIDSNYDSFDDAVSTNKLGVPKDPFLASLLNIKSTAIQDFEDSVKGYNRSRSDRLRDIVDNLDILTDPEDLNNDFSFEYMSAVNQRIHVMQTILDFQGDKFISRQIVTGGEYTTNSDQEVAVILGSIADTLGYTNNSDTDTIAKGMDDVLNGNTKYEDEIAILEKADGKIDFDTVKAIVESQQEKGKTVKQPFELIGALQGIVDVRKAYSAGTNVTTNYMGSFDASGSGVTNTLMNLSGDPHVQRILKLMSIEIDGKKPKDPTDPYSVLSGFIKDPKGMSQTLGISIIGKDYTKLQSEIQALLDGGIFKDDRTLAKFPVMRAFYGQSEENTATTMANDIVLALLDKAIEGNPYAKKMVRSITGKMTAAEITSQDINKLKDYYIENVTTEYTNAFKKVYKPVLDYQAKVGTIFKILNQLGNWDGTIPAAFQAMSNDTNRKHNMSVKKAKPEILEVDGDSVLSLTSTKHLNQTSLGVNPQHGLDAAQMFTGLEAIVDMDTQGILTIHDDAKASAKKLLAMKPAYEESIKSGALDYDFIGEMINTAQLLLDDHIRTSKDGKLPELYKSYAKQLVVLKKANDKMMQDKVAFLGKSRPDFFGMSYEDINTIPEYKGTVTKSKPKKKETKPKQERKVEPVIDKSVDTKPKQTPLNKVIQDLATQIISLQDLEALGGDIDLAKKNIVSTLRSLKSRLGSQDSEYRVILDKIATLYEEGKYELIMGEDNEFFATQGKVNVTPLGSKDLGKQLAKITGKRLSLKSVIASLGHEVDHAVHNAYIQEKMGSDPHLKYLSKVIQRITPSMLAKVKDKFLKDRLTYLSINTQLDLVKGMKDKDGKKLFTSSQAIKQAEIQSVKEFIAILRNEPQFAEEILNTIFPEDKGNYQKFKAQLARLFQRIKDFMFKNPKHVETLNVNMANTIIIAELVQFKSLVGDITSDVGTDVVTGLAASPKGLGIKVNPGQHAMTYYEQATEAANAYASNFIFSVIGLTADAAGPHVSEAHEKAKKKFPVYKGTVNLIKTGFYDSKFSNQLRVTLGLKGNYSKKVISDMARLGDEIMQSSKQLLTNDLVELSNSLKSNYTNAQLTKLNKIFARTGFAHLIESKLAKDLAEGTITLDDAIAKVSKGINKHEQRAVDMMVDYYLNGNAAIGQSNLESLAFEKFNELVALQALKQIPGSIKMLQDMHSKHPSIYQSLMMYTLSIKEQQDVINLNKSHLGIGEIQSTVHQYMDFDGFGTKDIFSNSYEYEIIKQSDLRTDKYSESQGWIMVREPSGTTYGVVARKSFSNGFSEGLGLNANRFMNGIPVDGRLTQVFDSNADTAVANNVLKTEAGYYRLVLTEDEKNKLDYDTNPAETLLRTFVANKEIIEADSTRKIVIDSLTEELTAAQTSYIVKQIGLEKSGKPSGPIPLFLSLNDQTLITDLPKEIQDYYTTPTGISTYGGFNKQVQLVRQDMAHILVGYKNAQLFTAGDPIVLQRAEDVFRKAVVMFKIKLVVANPLKLTIDAVSNMSYLMTMGVGITDIYKYGKEGFEAYHDLSKLRGSLIKAKMRYTFSKSSKDKKIMDRLERRIKANKFYTGEQYGFVQSYSTDLITKDFDVISGLQSDLDNIINKIIKDEKGDLNGIGSAIEWWSDFGSSKGFTIDQLLENSVRLSKTNGTTVGKEIVAMAKRLRKHKDEKRLDRFVGEILASPASELVKVGSTVMVTTDAISKYIYAQHLLGKAKRGTSELYTEEEAYLKANEEFIDYRLNMPPEIKALSDYAILMFPGFWMRIQRMIYLMYRDNPINAALATASADLSGIAGANIIDSNIIGKVLDGRVFNATNPFTLDTLFPF